MIGQRSWKCHNNTGRCCETNVRSRCILIVTFQIIFNLALAWGSSIKYARRFFVIFGYRPPPARTCTHFEHPPLTACVLYGRPLIRTSPSPPIHWLSLSQSGCSLSLILYIETPLFASYNTRPSMSTVVLPYACRLSCPLHPSYTTAPSCFKVPADLIFTHTH